MRRIVQVAMFVSLLVGTTLQGALAQQSDNIERLAQVPIVIQADDPSTEEDESTFAKGSDLAFQGNTVVAGSWEGIGLFKLLPKDPYIQQQSFALCPGAQGDVSVWGNLAFMSVDTPQVKSDGTQGDGGCDSIGASAAQVAEGLAWEGVRIFDISKPTRSPVLVGTVDADCGSHTHTLVPSGGKLYLYVLSYPLTGGLGPSCNYVVHRKAFIYEVDLKDPSKTGEEIVGTLDVSPAPGCHDVTVVPEKAIAIAACLVEGQIWDISDPTAPTILSRIHNPFMIFHSSAMTWDGKIGVLGDEFAGAAAGAGCVSPDGRLGAMWFYDLTDPSNPQEVGHWGPPRTAFPSTAESAARHACTTHNFNVLPMKDPNKYIAVSAYYAAGLSVVDFSDPANPEEMAYYVPEYEGGQQGDMWAAYWYNGRIYTNDVNLPRASASLPATDSAGVGVYEIKALQKNAVRYFRTRLNPQVQVYDFR
ncbi:MAG TPA: hypothetical protein VNC78_01245 [Actinomycetota bacterium]|nr:hypothetical protein [Actinomycetota bacterium]